MRYSQLIGRTQKEAPKDEVSNNARLLTRAGYIHKEMAGVYAFLPLGFRVLTKLIHIIREEMVAIGGQEVNLGSLQIPELWQKTGRWDDSVIDVWFKTHLHSGTEIGLATTHEEPLSQIMTQFISSYKDLPLYAFQFQLKFRNELRSKSGLLRTREFIMKDLYSFCKNEKELDEFYEKALHAYHRIFERAGIGKSTYLTFASGGAFSKYSHEFQTVCDAGEDTVYLNETKKIAINKEVYNAEVLNELGMAKDDFKECKAIEVGNIFKLGTKYSIPLNLYYSDSEGNKQPVVMGSYGIGPGRLLATIVETHHDENGIIWPKNLAPHKIHLIGLNLEDENTKKRVAFIYEKFETSGFDVLFDDREDITAGQKFADADLIGIPFRVTVSKRTGDKLELKLRNSETTELMDLDTLTSKMVLEHV